MLSRRVAVLRLVSRVLTPRASRLLPLVAQERPRTLRKVRRRVARPLESTALCIMVAKPEVTQTAPHVDTNVDAELVAPLDPHLPVFLRSRVLTVPDMLV